MKIFVVIFTVLLSANLALAQSPTAPASDLQSTALLHHSLSLPIREMQKQIRHAEEKANQAVLEHFFDRTIRQMSLGKQALNARHCGIEAGWYDSAKKLFVIRGKLRIEGRSETTFVTASFSAAGPNALTIFANGRAFRLENTSTSSYFRVYQNDGHGYLAYFLLRGDSEFGMVQGYCNL